MSMARLVFILGLYLGVIVGSVQEPVHPSPQSPPIDRGRVLLQMQARKSIAPLVYFSPKGGCTKIVVDSIKGAKSSIRMQAYSFTSKPILEALNAAQARKLDVQVILDKSQMGPGSASSQLTCLHFYDHAHAIAHNKVVIIDDEIILTGSFNYTVAAEEHNAENILLIRDPILAGQYLNNWSLHRAHSVVSP